MFFHLLKGWLPNLDISLISFRQKFLCTSFLSPPDPLEDPSPLATEELEGMSQNGMANFVSWTHFFMACQVETHAGLPSQLSSLMIISFYRLSLNPQQIF